MSHDQKGEAQAYPIANKSDFKAWVLQHPNPYKLLKEIIYQWRGSTIKARGARGVWTVYPVNQWAEWTGLSRDQAKRALRILEIDGLVARDYHKFTGKGVWLYLQPTKTALTYMGRPQDIGRLGDDPSAAHAPDGAPDSALKVTPDSAPDGAPDHTLPSPSSPTCPSSLTTLQASPHTCEEGKGKAGKDGKVKKALKIVSSSPKSSPTPQSPPPPPADDGQEAVDAMIAALKAKQLEKALKKFPILKGPHTKAVKHPSELYEGWPSWSLAKKIEKQAQYEIYVANWYAGKNGKKGKPYASLDDWTDEDEADFKAAMDALEFDD